MQDAIADNDDIRDAIADARLRRVGSAAWWRAVSDALDAYFKHVARAERVLAAYKRRAAPAQREQLGRQWLAFINAQAGDLLLQAQNEGMACQLCQQPIRSDRHHHVIDTAHCEILCTCQNCTDVFAGAKRDHTP